MWYGVFVCFVFVCGVNVCVCVCFVCVCVREREREKLFLGEREVVPGEKVKFECTCAIACECCVNVKMSVTT